MRRVLGFLLLFPLLVLGGLASQEEPKEIVIENRIVARVGDKAFSVMDVVKKMDYNFYRRFPQYADSLAMRYQYYTVNWKYMLEKLVRDAMLLADAETHKVEIPDGEVREELERTFGPDVIVNLDRMGMTFQEAWDLVEAELMMQQMEGAMVTRKARGEVTPKKIKEAYKEAALLQEKEHQWRYRVLAIRAAEEGLGREVAKRATQLIEKEGVAFELLPVHLQAEGLLGERVKVAVSEPYDRRDHELSLAHKAILQTLQVGQHSGLVEGKDGTLRLFCLEKHEAGKVESFKEMRDKIEQSLLEKALVKEDKSYMEQLRKRYGVDERELKESGFENPFALR